MPIEKADEIREGRTPDGNQGRFDFLEAVSGVRGLWCGRSGILLWKIDEFFDERSDKGAIFFVHPIALDVADRLSQSNAKINKKGDRLLFYRARFQYIK